MIWYERDVQYLETQVRPTVRRGESVVFYGSSSVRLWLSLQADFPDCHAVNMGFGGSTLAGCAWFFDRVFRDVEPRAVVVYAGENDLGDGRHPEEVFLFYQAFHFQFRQRFPELPLTFVSVKPSPARASIVSQIKHLNDLVARSLSTDERGLFVDVFTPMMQATPNLRDLYTADGLHMAPSGYAVWRTALLAQRSRVFGS